MTGKTVRITDQMHETLRQLAEDEHETMQAVLARALERYRRERMFARTDEIYAAMTPEEWEEEEAEREAWDTLTHSSPSHNGEGVG